MSNISAKPNPRYRFLFFKSLQKNYFFQKFIFFNTGREALLYGLKKLKLDHIKIDGEVAHIMAIFLIIGN